MAPFLYLSFKNVYSLFMLTNGMKKDKVEENKVGTLAGTVASSKDQSDVKRSNGSKHFFQLSESSNKHKKM